jgi:hypothetical protein
MRLIPRALGLKPTASISNLFVYICLYCVAVPIYDGRSGFSFKGADFDNIQSLPLYENGNIDLHPYSIVSVGYSVNTYKYTVGGESALALSPNILFVILLGMPVE